MPDQLYDDNGKPLAAGGVQYDDNGKPIAGVLRTAPQSASDYYWQAFKDFGEGIGTSVKKTVNAINPFGDSPARPTQAQEAAQLAAELKNAPPLNFDPRVTGRAIWKGVTNLTAKDVGEGVGDIGQMYLMGKVAGAVEPETVRAGVNMVGRAGDVVGRGSTKLGDAALPSSPLAATISAATNHPAAAVGTVAVPLALKYGGKGLSAISKWMQSEPVTEPFINPYATRTGGIPPPSGGGPDGPGGGPGGPSWSDYTVPAPPPAPPPPPGLRPTGTGSPATPPPAGAGTEPWTATRPGEPPPIVQPQTGTGSPSTVMGGPNVGWNQWTPGRDPVPPPKVPAEPNTLLGADELKQMLEDVRQQPSNDPVTKASGPPPRTTTAGGRPSQTQVEYDALQEAAARRQALEKEVDAKSPVADEADVTGAPDEAEAAAEQARRNAVGADKRASETGQRPEDVRGKTANRLTGESGTKNAILPEEPADRVLAKAKTLIENGKTDAELKKWAETRADGSKTDEKTLAQLQTMFHTLGRPIYLAAGAVATGAMLRNALVGQLQGDQKQEQD